MKNKLFIVGNTIATIRKSNTGCVDIRDANGKLINWWCLDYVLNHPEMFIPVVICEDIGKKKKLKIIQKPFEISRIIFKY